MTLVFKGVAAYPWMTLVFKGTCLDHPEARDELYLG